MGRHISPYGIGTVSTPNCERLAQQSLVLENCFCTAPRCSPARSSIVTGRYPHSNGVMGLTQKDYTWRLHEEERPVASILGAAGYATWLLGLQHESPDPNALGFDEVDLGFSLLDASSISPPCLTSITPSSPFTANSAVSRLTDLSTGRAPKRMQRTE